MVSGRLNKQIADVLGISERTIKAHRHQIMYKMGCNRQPSWEACRVPRGELFLGCARSRHGATGARLKNRACGGAPPVLGSKICPKVQYQGDRQMCENRGGEFTIQNIPVSKSTIAIVEDDASYRRALERLLRASGFEAYTFASAEKFLGSAAPESHACLILDIHLPGMSGFDLLDHLTASGQSCAAILMTGQDQDSLRERASRIPDCVYLRKPFVGTVLLDALRSLLGSKER